MGTAKEPLRLSFSRGKVNPSSGHAPPKSLFAFHARRHCSAPSSTAEMGCPHWVPSQVIGAPGASTSRAGLMSDQSVIRSSIGGHGAGHVQVVQLLRLCGRSKLAAYCRSVGCSARISSAGLEEMPQYDLKRPPPLACRADAKHSPRQTANSQPITSSA